jgi:Cys-rich protein (TIGR01571 family)
MVSWCCGVCQLSYQKAAVEEHPCGVGDCIPVMCCPICCQVSIRGKIREKYGLDGSCCVDFLLSAFCALCAVSQQTRQLDLKGAKPAGCFMED